MHDPCSGPYGSPCCGAQSGSRSIPFKIQRVADGDYRYGFQEVEILGPVDSTRYDGRIWADKTVSIGDFVVTGPAAGEDGLTIHI